MQRQEYPEEHALLLFNELFQRMHLLGGARGMGHYELGVAVGQYRVKAVRGQRDVSVTWRSYRLSHGTTNDLLGGCRCELS